MAPRKPAAPATPRSLELIGELGSTGLNRSGGHITEEFLTVLRGQRGIKTYAEMASNDPIVGAILLAFEKLLTRLDWRFDAAEDSGPKGEEVAEFFTTCLNDMSESWDSTLSGIASMLPFGWSWHEIVYKYRRGDTDDPSTRSKYSDGKIGWRKMPIRAQDTLVEWLFDDHGGTRAFRQQDPNTGAPIDIPIEKSLLFRTVTAKGNPEGRSVLRNAYRPWFFKKRIEEIEAIGIERDLAGLPVGKIPPEYLASTATAEQVSVRNAMERIVRGVKRNEAEGVLMPMAYDAAGNELFSLELLSTGGSRQFDTDAIVARYDQRISMSVLADFLLLGHEKVGSYSLGISKMELFARSIEAWAKSIAEVFNQYAVPRLMRLNGIPVDLQPDLAFGEVMSVDLVALGEFISKMTTAGAINTDDALEDYLREAANLPAADHDHDDEELYPAPPKLIPVKDADDEIEEPGSEPEAAA